MAASAEQHDAAKSVPRRVGIVATDPLRVIGLQAILDRPSSDGGPAFQVIELSTPRALDAEQLGIVFVDSEATPHLIQLLATFKRARPELRLIVLGSRASLDHIESIIAAGAKGYLTYTATEAELRMAIAVVDDGSVWAPRKVMARLVDAADKMRGTAVLPPLDLTARETQVLNLLIKGLTNRDIADQLRIDESTVKAHLSRLMRKVGVSNRTALTVQALKYGDTQNPQD